MKHAVSKFIIKKLFPKNIVYNNYSELQENIVNIIVKDEKFYTDVVWNGSLGLGETYMKNYWECDNIPLLIDSILRSNSIKNIYETQSKVSSFSFNDFNSLEKSDVVVKNHYEISNELYSDMLGPTMSYTCAYWEKGAATLDQAQEAKLDMICRKLQLKETDTLLDIGCGWGSLVVYAAKNYKCKVVGVNLSKEHLSFAAEWVKRENLEESVRFINCDYRNIQDYTFEKYDKIVSVGFFEHVGKNNIPEYFKVVNHLLKDDGLSLLHTITSSNRKNNPDKFISKYIFPGGFLHHVDNIISEISLGDLTILHNHEFGLSYAKTLVAWNENVQKSDAFKAMSPEFQRMWKYYLLSCSGAFLSRNILLHQIVFSKKSMEYTYV